MNYSTPPLRVESPFRKHRGDLVFGPETVLPPARSRPLRKIVRILDSHLSGLVTTNGDLDGVELGSLSFVRGTLVDAPDAPTHLHVRQVGEPPSVEDVDCLSVVTGVCLFGGSGLHAYDRGGKPTVMERPGMRPAQPANRIAEIERGETQIYVPEVVARLGRTMIALVVLADRYGIRADLYIHIPGPEYKLYADGLFAAGRMTRNARQQYHNLVDDEALSITTQFTDLFESVATRPPTYGSPLGRVFPAHPGLAMASTDVPSTIQNILAASYVSAYRTAVRANTLPVFVDDVEELPILRNAQQLSGFRGIALYPLPACLSGSKAGSLFDHHGATGEEIAQATAPWLGRRAG
ncbi:hypothetical protein AB0C34_10495 [Nocardia sp. NPDC049220]|uniref:hypothetical protein n=1 Tax=Nocardia sp. NPDC049220 TaxID=3155273 RepID=UPI0033C9D03D